jgi:hypothetical protein
MKHFTGGNMNTKEKVLIKQVIFLATPEEHQVIRDLSKYYDISIGELMRDLVKKKHQETKARELMTSN